MTGSMKFLTAAAFIACVSAWVPAQAQTVMQQCGQQYQAAKAAGTLGGMSWKQFRTDCAAKLKAQPASTTAPSAATPAGNPLAPETPAVAPAVTPAPAASTATTAATTAAAPAKAPATGGRAAMLARQRQCGADWKAQKATLVAQTPGLTWPKYWSQCNKRLKAAGQ